MSPTTNILVVTLNSAGQSDNALKTWSELLGAIAWPVAVLVILAFFIKWVLPILAENVKKGGSVRVKVSETEVAISGPTEGLRPPSAGTSNQNQEKLTKNIAILPNADLDTLPLDYYFLNHTSFLKQEKQEEYRRKTGVSLDHYNIHVVVDSYYEGALDRVDKVEYILHEAYPEPIQYRRNKEDKFLLKQLANGEYVLMARVFLKDREQPVLLQRYITLWSSGPRIG
jgi:pYEATS domain-containing protein involved in immunity